MELEGIDVSKYHNLDNSEYKDQIDAWFSGGSQKNSNASEIKTSISKEIREHIMMLRRKTTIKQSKPTEKKEPVIVEKIKQEKPIEEKQPEAPNA